MSQEYFLSVFNGTHKESKLLLTSPLAYATPILQLLHRFHHPRHRLQHLNLLKILHFFTLKFSQPNQTTSHCLDSSFTLLLMVAIDLALYRSFRRPPVFISFSSKLVDPLQLPIVK